VRCTESELISSQDVRLKISKRFFQYGQDNFLSDSDEFVAGISSLFEKKMNNFMGQKIKKSMAQFFSLNFCQKN